MVRFVPVSFMVDALAESVRWARAWHHDGEGKLSLMTQLPRRFSELLRIRTAPRMIVRKHDNGFFANFLSVLDALVHKGPEARVFIDWTLRGDEEHFKYGDVGDNVWDRLFEPFASHDEIEAARGRCVIIKHRISAELTSRNRDRFHQSQRFQAERARYAEVYRRLVHVKNQDVLREVESLHRERLQGKHAIGVHKRMALPEVADHQAERELPSTQRLVEATRRLVDRAPRKDAVVFLASDDAEAVALFGEAFGDRLVCRQSVQRARVADGVEVHRRPWVQISLKDASDVLVDGLLLARCQQVLHLSSNVTTSVALMNPDVEMVHATDLVPAR